MIIIREVFVAKPGQASKLAKLFKKGFGSRNERSRDDRHGGKLQHGCYGDAGEQPG